MQENARRARFLAADSCLYVEGASETFATKAAVDGQSYYITPDVIEMSMDHGEFGTWWRVKQGSLECGAAEAGRIGSQARCLDEGSGLVLFAGEL